MKKEIILSVVINTKNSAETLAATLESIKGIADEIVIVDMLSTDDTVKIAKKYTDHVFMTEKDYGYVEPARNFALTKAQGEWIFILDADEEAEEPLAKVVRMIADGTAEGIVDADAYYIPRKNIIFNKWIEKTGWWPDGQLRLFKKGKVEWSDVIHAQPTITGKVANFPSDERLAILHHNYQTVHQFIERLNRYTDVQAVSDTSSAKNPKLSAAEVIDAFTNEFFQRCFVSKGIDEGIHGVSLSLLMGMYMMVTSLKKWEAAHFSQTGNDQLQTFAALRRLQKGLEYWMADWQVRNTSGLAKLYWMLKRKLSS